MWFTEQVKHFGSEVTKSFNICVWHFSNVSWFKFVWLATLVFFILTSSKKVIAWCIEWVGWGSKLWHKPKSEALINRAKSSFLKFGSQIFPWTRFHQPTFYMNFIISVSNKSGENLVTTVMFIKKRIQTSESELCPGGVTSAETIILRSSWNLLASYFSSNGCVHFYDSEYYTDVLIILFSAESVYCTWEYDVSLFV